MGKSLQDKVVVVTGASSGIGEACARCFFDKGAIVVLAARNIEKLTSLQKSITNSQDRILCVQTDVSKEEDCQHLIQTAVEKFGRIDILVNNAGISMRALFKDLDLKVLHQLMDTNFWGSVYCTKYALPSILSSGGSIVGVSSIAGYRGLPGRTGYSASKFALQGFLEALRTEHLHDGIHVLLVCPGFTSSNIRNVALTDTGKAQGDSPRDEQKMMTSEEVARHLVDAVEKRKRTIILTKQGKLTVFLNKWLPKMMDGLVYNHMAKEPDSPFKKQSK